MRKNLSGAKSGFTIIEIIIAIVIIGILATIVTVSYIGVSQKAVVASLQSDLSNAIEQLRIYKIQNNDSYPTSIDCSAAPAANTICFKASSKNTISTLSVNNAVDPKTFCVGATNVNGTGYFATNIALPAAGSCP